MDRYTIQVNFSVAKPFPYQAFVGYNSPILQKAQFKDCAGARAQECNKENFYPIGTGPFVVKDFKANDVIVFEANPNYRDSSKPAFQTLVFKGGGDAVSAARAVLETGEIDYEEHGKGGTTRVVGIYIDPLVKDGIVKQGSDHDSQRRFQNDLNIDNLTVKASGDYDRNIIYHSVNIMEDIYLK